MRADDAFSLRYAQARERFIESATAAGLLVESRLHPEKGRDGEDLAMDVARDGDPSAPLLLVISSACHGVEGYCGSGVQVAALRDAEWMDHARAKGVAVLYIHGLNPYGFSHLRRVTHENVDLNRNFHDFGQTLPVNSAYAQVHDLLLPEQWPPTAENQAALERLVAERGQAWFQGAVTGGQHSHADGLFFGGTAPTWSNKVLREVMRTHGRRAARIAWIDIHTGLGPSGHGERIFAGRNSDPCVARARSWWAGGGRTPVTSIYDGTSASAVLTGMMFNAAYDECPQAEYTGIAMEYGTVPMMQVIQALRGDHWLAKHPEAPPELASRIKRELIEAFYIDTPEWKEQVLTQARESLFQAVDGLAEN